MIVRVLANIGAAVRDCGMMYKAVAQSALLYGSKSWMLMGEMLNVLEGFHQWEARNITGMTTKLGDGREWEYPPVVVAL